MSLLFDVIVSELPVFHFVFYKLKSSPSLPTVCFHLYLSSRKGKPQLLLESKNSGVPEWLSQLSIRLLVSALVMISGSWD